MMSHRNHPEQLEDELDRAKARGRWLSDDEQAVLDREADAEAMDITSISDMAEAVNAGEDLLFASNAEFYARPDGLRPMQDIYGFQFERSDIKRMDTGLTYTALRDGLFTEEMLRAPPADLQNGQVIATPGVYPDRLESTCNDVRLVTMKNNPSLPTRESLPVL